MDYMAQGGLDGPKLADYDPSLVWIVVLSFIVAFFLAFGIGANDVANSFGTSVGSKVLTLRQACILATIFEILGAMTLGFKVSSTIRTGMIEVVQFEDAVKLLMIGYLAALIGGAIWNLVATFIGFPISGTHSIVGAIVGFAIVARGFAVVKWMEILKIVASWFVSPLLSGLVSVALFFLIRMFILNKDKPLEPGLKSLPLFYGFTIFINVFSIVHDGPHIFSSITWWMALCIAVASGLVIALIVWFLVVPRQRTKISNRMNSVDHNVNEGDIDLPTVKPLKNEGKETNGTDKTSNNNKDRTSKGSIKVNQEENKVNENEKEKVESSVEIPGDKTEIKDDPSKDKPEVAQLFSFLQILTACFGSFAHGANDVSNAIGPLVAVMLLYQKPHYAQLGDTPWYILLYGGMGISIGLWIWGRKVIQTMGSDLTSITPSSGFTIEIGAATTVLMASKIGLPISTTHCKVGSVVMVGRLRSKEGVDWKLFRNIAIAWILTVPITALCSAGAMALLQMAA